MFNLIPTLKKPQLVAGTENIYEMSESMYINYDNIPRKVKNIFISVKIPDEYINNPYTWESWYVRDEDTPELMSEKYYGDVSYYWVILLFNNMVNKYDDWPLTEKSFEKRILREYGNIRYSMILPHCYVKVSTRVVTSDDEDVIIEDEEYKVSKDTYELLDDAKKQSYRMVSKYEYELGLNDESRNIKLLKSEYMAEFINEFKRIANL
jgi:hypothetical protein